MAKSNEQIAEQVRAGGNLPPGFVFDATKDEVRKITAEEQKAADDAAAAEERAARTRKTVIAELETARAEVVTSA